MMKTAFVCTLLHVIGCFALDYSDLVSMGVNCQGRDSCAALSDPDDFFKRNCECDNLCHSFDDCCIDAPGVSDQTMKVPKRNRLLQCMPFGKLPNQGAYVISSCPRPDDPSNDDCTSKDFHDPLLQAPVSTPGGATYRNTYCAACNGADLTTLVPWPVLVNCESLAPYNLSDDFVWQNLERDVDDAWVVTFEDQLHDCDVLFDKPDTVYNLRLCRADVVSTCPGNYRRQKVRRLCESYVAIVHTVNASYRNPHCAVCHGEAIKAMVCDRNELLFRKGKPFSFALLLDVNRSDGDLVGVSQEVNCPNNQKYDPFFKKCRDLVCAIPGYKMVGNKCQKI